MTVYPWHRETPAFLEQKRKRVAQDQAFVRWLSMTDVFHMTFDAPGVPLFTPPWQAHKDFRADLLLSPTDKALEQHWPLGAIVLAFNQEFEDPGYIINRLADFNRGCFIVKGQRVCPSYAFLMNSTFDLTPDFCSVLFHQRVGIATYSADEGILTLASPYQSLLTVSGEGQIHDEEAGDDPEDLDSLGYVPQPWI